MSSKAQHARGYRSVPQLLRSMREQAGMTQRDIGIKLRKPQSWVHNSETANRRVDVSEFMAWCEACGVKPHDGLDGFLRVK